MDIVTGGTGPARPSRHLACNHGADRKVGKRRYGMVRCLDCDLAQLSSPTGNDGQRGENDEKQPKAENDRFKAHGQPG